MTNDDLLQLLDDAATAVHGAVAVLTDWGLAGTRAGQYKCDLAADDALLAVLGRAPVGVMSEESGLTNGDRGIVVVADPIDGSTNASAGLPWFATSLCAVDGDGPRAAVVVNQATGTRYRAARGDGATIDGQTTAPLRPVELRDAFVGVSGLPDHHLGWRQFRALGASALDICAVAAGVLDAFIDCTARPAHGPWDYLGAMLVCHEAGAVVTDRYGEDLVVLDHLARRTPIAASSDALLQQCIKSLNK
ncbi:MAG TPA: inositol monophosphatase family protein [Acidimicrobiales bacterium]|nr:inositol monophosphatase family protein [Acidimicrobiales bacterium]